MAKQKPNTNWSWLFFKNWYLKAILWWKFLHSLVHCFRNGTTAHVVLSAVHVMKEPNHISRSYHHEVLHFLFIIMCPLVTVKVKTFLSLSIASHLYVYCWYHYFSDFTVNVNYFLIYCPLLFYKSTCLQNKILSHTLNM